MVMLIYIDLLFQPFGDRLDLPTYQGFPDSSVGKESTCNAGDPGSIPGFGRSAGEGIGYPLQYSWASLVAQLVKNPPAMRETWVGFLGWKDPLEKGKATHSSIWPGEFHGLYSAAAAAAVAKSLQSFPTLCHPLDSSPQGSTIPGTLQARTLEWVAISFYNA